MWSTVKFSILSLLAATAMACSGAPDESASSESNIEQSSPAADRAHGMAILKFEEDRAMQGMGGTATIKELPLPESRPAAVDEMVKKHTTKRDNGKTSEEATLSMYEVPGYGPHYVMLSIEYDLDGNMHSFPKYIFDEKGTLRAYDLGRLASCSHNSWFTCSTYMIKVGDKYEAVEQASPYNSMGF